MDSLYFEVKYVTRMPCKAQGQALALKERTTEAQPTSAVDHSHSGERKKVLTRENLVCAFSSNFFPSLNFREVNEMTNVIWAFPPLENSKWAPFNSPRNPSLCFAAVCFLRLRRFHKYMN